MRIASARCEFSLRAMCSGFPVSERLSGASVSPMRVLSLLIVVATAPGILFAAEPTPEQAAEITRDPDLFLATASKMFEWESPAEPFKLVGPIHFVGTKGLAVWLITGSQGHVLLNTAMPGSGPMIEASIRKLGFDPQDIKLILASHAHVDHVGAHAYMRSRIDAQVAIIAGEQALLESGGKTDPFYAEARSFAFEPVAADRVFRDGDTQVLGDVAITPHLTPGHSPATTTWTMQVIDAGRVYQVVFPDGTGVNPGYRLLKSPNYPGIEGDYRDSLHTLERMKPDIWLHSHNVMTGFERKRARMTAAGVSAWVDPEGFRRFVAAQRAAFEAAVEREAAPMTEAGEASAAARARSGGLTSRGENTAREASARQALKTDSPL